MFRRDHLGLSRVLRDVKGFDDLASIDPRLDSEAVATCFAQIKCRCVRQPLNASSLLYPDACAQRRRSQRSQP